MPNLENCPQCGGLFIKAFRNICEKCQKELDANFEKVYGFIRKKENRMASMEEVCSKTEVPEEQIYRFIKEGRLKLSHFPNLGYPCDSCGTMIREGRLCSSCQQQISQDLKQYDTGKQVQARNIAREKEKDRIANRQGTYKSLNEYLDD
ncbi:TIGR03826 family flagellar region protein [Bacillus sp. FJAT-45350]|uniref:TIGR03826 family flagellar region protein n=1 Tax=Bacillus sp. FJAT-45350 TaxID=2011014 RepID=UPI000BB96DF8|nr:TIGR03826 family flagellar region protein [Bacillus sp. FJAT-45350]